MLIVGLIAISIWLALRKNRKHAKTVLICWGVFLAFAAVMGIFERVAG